MHLGPDFSHVLMIREDISWRMRKSNGKQNRFQIVMIFFTFFFSIFLRHYVTYVPAGFGKVLLALILGCHGRIQRGDRGPGPPPPETSQKFRVSKQYWSQIQIQDLLKITKLPSQHSILGHYRPASETPFKWRFAGGSMIARL